MTNTKHYFDGDDGDCAFCYTRKDEADEDAPDESCMSVERQREKVMAMAALCGLALFDHKHCIDEEPDECNHEPERDESRD